jgi:hypothetical protein
VQGMSSPLRGVKRNTTLLLAPVAVNACWCSAGERAATRGSRATSLAKCDRCWASLTCAIVRQSHNDGLLRKQLRDSGLHRKFGQRLPIMKNHGPEADAGAPPRAEQTNRPSAPSYEQRKDVILARSS